MNFENKIVIIKPVDSKKTTTVVKNVLYKYKQLSADKLLYESLILAQDERWRRA